MDKDAPYAPPLPPVGMPAWGQPAPPALPVPVPFTKYKVAYGAPDDHTVTTVEAHNFHACAEGGANFVVFNREGENKYNIVPYAAFFNVLYVITA